MDTEIDEKVRYSGVSTKYFLIQTKFVIISFLKSQKNEPSNDGMTLQYKSLFSGNAYVMFVVRFNFFSFSVH